MAKQLVNRALNGDYKAFDKLLVIFHEAEAQEKKMQQEPQEICWSEEQEKLFQELQGDHEEQKNNLDEIK